MIACTLRRLEQHEAREVVADGEDGGLLREALERHVGGGGRDGHEHAGGRGAGRHLLALTAGEK
jgi:hypothetical protein